MNNGLLGFPKGVPFPRGLLAWPLGRSAYPGYATETFNQEAAQTYFQVVTAAGSANAKGSWTTVVAAGAAEWDADGIILSTKDYSGIGTFLFDLALGDAGSERVIMENLLYAGRTTGSGTNITVGCPAFVPLMVPGGTRLAARVQASAASANSRWMVTLVRGGFYRIIREMMQFQRAVTYGAVTSADTGGAPIDPGGVANTKGTWQDIGVTTEDHRAFLICPSKQPLTAAGIHFRLDVAFDREEQYIYNDWQMGTAAGSGGNGGGMGMAVTPLMYVDVPAGTRLLGRAMSSSTTAGDRVIDVTVIGFS